MSRYIVFDVETPNFRNDRISAIGITVLEDDKIAESFYTLVNPEAPFDEFNIQLTGISPQMVQDAPTFPELWQRIAPLMSSGIPVAHNALFDLGVLKKCFQDYDIFWQEKTPYLCTVQMGRQLLPGMSHKLNVLAEYYQIALDHHQADSDSRACAEILRRYMAQEGDLKKFVRYFTFGTSKQEFASAAPDRMEDAVLREDQSVSCDPSAAPDLSSARALLAQIYGYQDFRPGQASLIEAILRGKDVLGVMPTGSGKSICYQIPAMLLPGTSLVISPLISLMKDQVAALRNRGLAAACLNSNMEDEEYAETFRQAVRGRYKLLYVAPERLNTPGFQRMCEQLRIPLVAVDEAHCISQWGQDFRPSYLKITDFIAQLTRRPVIGAFTATATPRVNEDIRNFLHLRQPVQACTGFDRPNLSFSVYEPKDKDAALLELLRDRFQQSGIVYCSTRKNVEAVCEKLNQEGFSATRYHAGLSPEERVRNQEDFLFDRKRVMVATNAFGMGIDKSNVSYVIHYNMPKSLEAYYQEAGRAGRDGCDADCVLLYSGQDVMMARWLIEHSDPNPDLSPEEQTAIREKDEERLKRMTFYARSKKCLRRDILRYFGEEAPEKCGNCSNCVPDCEHVDITTDAQMILSCVARGGQELSRECVMDILLGIVPDEVPAGLNAQEMSTFGLMRETSPYRLREEIRALCDQGYLETDAGDDHILRLNQRSREVLFHHQRVAMRRNRRNQQAQKASADEDLLHALLRLRYEISGKERIAASTLFTDGTLREICLQRPRNQQQLAKVEGMGIFKANRYGNLILPLIEQYAPAKPRAKKGAAQEKTQRTFTEYKESLMSQGKVSAYEPWTEEEDSRLLREYREELSLTGIAKAHQRTRGAIQSRLRKLGAV